MPSREVRYNGTPSALVSSRRHYRRVPKERLAHLKFRRDVERRCETDVDFRAAIYRACAEDVLFWINLFVYVVEPRRAEVRPFNTWPHQDELIAELDEHWGQEDFVCDKSREQGATWIMAALLCHRFIFHKNQSLGFASMNEETADDPNDLGSFGARIDYILERLPWWMINRADIKETALDPKLNYYTRNLTKHTWKRVGRGGNSIKAFAATGELATGFRYTAFVLDEAAKFPAAEAYALDANLQRVTDCAIWVSTFYGTNNAFYDKVFGDNDWVRLILDWRDNPAHNEHLYRTTAGQLEILDPVYNDGQPLADYPYELDGLERSIWLDRQWVRAGRNMIWLKQELYRDPEGSKGRPFPPAVVTWARSMCRDPLDVGTLLYDEKDPSNQRAHQWLSSNAYKGDIWRPVDHFGRMYVGKPVMGIDLSHGTSGDTSSNSVLSVWDALNGEQILELATNAIYPVDFARLAVAICWWLSPSGECFMVPEKNGGHGRTFMEEVVRLGYSNIYMDDAGGGQHVKFSTKKSDMPGFHTVRTSTTLEPLLAMLTHQQVTPRSAALIAECAEYEIDDKAKWVHPRSVNSRDASALGEGHGDRAIAAACAMRGMRERGFGRWKAKETVCRGSMEGRMARAEDVQRMRKLASCRY